MTEKFAALPEEKRMRVLIAVMREFGRDGYGRASTNAVAAEAEISKGSVFVYFVSKKEMYLYAVRRAAEALSSELFDLVDFEEGDFFARMSQIRDLKLALFSRYPPLGDFLLNMVKETSAEVADEARPLWSGVVGKMGEAMLKGLDESLFRGDIPFFRSVEIIESVITAYEKKVRAALETRSLDGAFLAEWDAEWNELIDILRKIFYKGGEAL